MSGYTFNVTGSNNAANLIYSSESSEIQGSDPERLDLLDTRTTAVERNNETQDASLVVLGAYNQVQDASITNLALRATALDASVNKLYEEPAKKIMIYGVSPVNIAKNDNTFVTHLTCLDPSFNYYDTSANIVANGLNFISLYNTQSIPIKLTGYKLNLQDASNAIDIDLSNITIKSKSFLLIHPDVCNNLTGTSLIGKLSLITSQRLKAIFALRPDITSLEYPRITTYLVGLPTNNPIFTLKLNDVSVDTVGETVDGVNQRLWSYAPIRKEAIDASGCKNLNMYDVAATRGTGIITLNNVIDYICPNGLNLPLSRVKTDSKQYKILVIGSSFSYFESPILSMLRVLFSNYATSAYIDALTFSSTSLALMDNSGSTNPQYRFKSAIISKLQSEDWTHVIVGPGSNDFSLTTSIATSKIFLNNVLNTVRSYSAAKLYVLQMWGVNNSNTTNFVQDFSANVMPITDDNKKFNPYMGKNIYITTATDAIGSKTLSDKTFGLNEYYLRNIIKNNVDLSNETLIIPVGRAFYDLSNSPYLFSDGTHPFTTGFYAQALTIFGAITNRDVASVVWSPAIHHPDPLYVDSIVQKIKYTVNKVLDLYGYLGDGYTQYTPITYAPLTTLNDVNNSTNTLLANLKRLIFDNSGSFVNTSPDIKSYFTL